MSVKCILGCKPIADMSVHMFPNPNKYPKRFYQWVDIVGGLRGDTAEQFFRKRKICDIHFAEECWNRNNRLNAVAVPTLHLKGNAENINNYRTRRSKQYEMIEEYLEYSDAEDNVKHSDFVECPMYKDTYQIKKEAEDVIDKVHEGFKCNVCQGQIIGFRYVCVECTDWDMCGSCEARGAHRQHYVLRLPGPRPCAELQIVLECIRRELFQPHAVPDNIHELEDDLDLELSPNRQDFATEYLDLSSEEDTVTNNDRTQLTPPFKKRKPNRKVKKKSPKQNVKTYANVKSNFRTANTKTTVEGGKVTKLMKLNLPPGVKLESFRKSLKKDLVVNVKRLPQSISPIVNKHYIVKEEKKMKEKEKIDNYLDENEETILY